MCRAGGTASKPKSAPLDPATRALHYYVIDVYLDMLTIVETPTFVEEAARIWSDGERLDFFAWIASQPEAGIVIPGSGGCRKVRWSRPGAGKQGGTRVIYFTRLQAGELWMLLVYPKAVKDDIPRHILRQIRKELEDVRH
jgi:hypothetical protein